MSSRSRPTRFARVSVIVCCLLSLVSIEIALPRPWLQLLARPVGAFGRHADVVLFLEAELGTVETMLAYAIEYQLLFVLISIGFLLLASWIGLGIASAPEESPRTAPVATAADGGERIDE